MLRRVVAFAVVCVFAFVARAAAQEDGKTIAGIGPVGEIKKLHTGFGFTEGPAADRAGNLFFTDIPNEKVHKVDAAGKLSTFIEKSGHANGLMWNAKGELLACQMDGQVVAYAADGKSHRVLAGKFKEKRFNAPNDLVVDAAGGVYFTDPQFRAPMPLPQDKLGVYYVSASGDVTRLVDDLKSPNGVILSPDEKTLYVIPSGQAEMYAYPVEGPGKIGAGKVLCKLKQPNDRGNGGGDGLTIDTKGNLYITSGLGLQVLNPEGKLLGIIKFPEQPANVTFGGKDRKTLYVTARTSLYTCEMEATGHAFAQEKKSSADAPGSAPGDKVTLFDGKTLTGWDISGCDVEIVDGAMLLKQGNGLIRSQAKYADFVLEWQCKNVAKEKYDSGVYVRFDLPLPKGRAWPRQYQINMKEGQEGNLVGDVKEGESKGLYKAGEWNRFKLTVNGTAAALEINDKPAWKVDGLKGREGYVGIQCETPAGGQFYFKEIVLTKLAGVGLSK